MQVSQLQDYDTHMIVGGGQARAFRMAETAEFFTVLSATLYRDKKRAVVREVLCNAWDAHIATGQSERPVEITLTDEELRIVDYGPGIPDEKMVDIYCVYGASTKANDGTQTGGFGLGSKAPFAYSDHFTVTSKHKGRRTVYAVSRGGSDTDGRPGLQVMSSAPTDESGLSVSIPIASADDVRKFTDLVRELVETGGILAKLNGELLSRYEYEKAKAGFFLAPITHARRGISVLYGAVTYPIDTIDTDVIAVCDRLSRVIGSHHHLVLIAAPNSLGVTPSRESLSFTDRTKATIIRLATRAHNMIGAELRRAARILAKHDAARLEDCITQGYLSSSNPAKGYVNWRLVDQTPLNVATEILLINYRAISNDIMAKFFAYHHAKSHRDMRRPLRRLSLSGKNDPIDPSKSGSPYVSIKAVLKKEFTKFSTRLIMRVAAKHGILGNLFFENCDQIFQARKNIPTTIFGKMLFIAQSQKMALAAIKENEDIEPYRGSSVLIIPEKNTELRRLVKADAEKFGYKVVEILSEKKPVVPVVKEVRKFHTMGEWLHSLKPSVETPKIYIIKRAKGFNFADDHKHLVNKLFPETVVVYESQVNIVRNMGAISIQEAIMSALAKIFKSKAAVWCAAIQSRRIPVRDIIRQFSLAHLEFAKIIFPDRCMKDPKLSEKYDLIRFVRLLENSGFAHKNETFLKLMTDFNDRVKKLTERYEGDLGKQIDKSFAFLDVLSTYNLASLTKLKLEMYVTLLRAGERAFKNKEIKDE